jgi:putative endonuclease
MNEEEQTLNNEPSSSWHVYIVRCKDNSYYTGVTTNLSRRIEEHNSGKKGARYTRSRRPVELVYFEKSASRSIATRREAQIKKLTLASKKQLIKTCRTLQSGGIAVKPT